MDTGLYSRNSTGCPCACPGDLGLYFEFPSLSVADRRLSERLVPCGWLTTKSLANTIVWLVSRGTSLGPRELTVGFSLQVSKHCRRKHCLCFLVFSVRGDSLTQGDGLNYRYGSLYGEFCLGCWSQEGQEVQEELRGWRWEKEICKYPRIERCCAVWAHANIPCSGHTILLFQVIIKSNNLLSYL